MKRRYLNIAHELEVIRGRLNLSSKDAESKSNVDQHDNTTYVKKIGNYRGVVSAPCQKYNMNLFAEMQGFEIARKEFFKESEAKAFALQPADPFNYINEDIFGFMRAKKITITAEEFEQLPEKEKKLYKKDGKNKYKQNITKKRKGRFHLSPLVNVSNGRIDKEFGICSTNTNGIPLNSEVYSGIFAGYGNFNIEDVGKFTISSIESEFRDYADEEDLSIEDVTMTTEEKFKRIETILRALEYLSISGNQHNYLTDTSLKLVILGEYSWGNNVFQGCLTGQGIDVDALKETLEENERFRTSDIWIGISGRVFNPETKQEYKRLKNELENELKEAGFDFVHVTSVKKAFDGYLDFLKETL